MVSYMVNKYDPSLIVSKPVAWTNEIDDSYYGICGYSNKVFNITQTFFSTILVVDVLIGLTGCCEEGCEEEYRCLNYTCNYCKANSFKEALKNVCNTCSNWNWNNYDEKAIKTLENNIKTIEEILLKKDCLPILSCSRLEVDKNEY